MNKLDITRHELYQGEVQIDFHDDKHKYYIGKTVIDGVTTILSVINKPMLVQWSANQASQCFYDKCMLDIDNLDEIKLQEILSLSKYAHKVSSGRAASIGSLAHNWIESYIKALNLGIKVPDMPKNEQACNCIRTFLGLEKELINEYIFSERIVYSRDHRYVGTLDILAKLNDGTIAIIDLKTSNGIYDEYLLQLAAYRQAVQEEFPRYKVTSGVIIRIGKDGSLELVNINEDELELCFTVFRSALSLSRGLRSAKSILEGAK